MPTKLKYKLLISFCLMSILPILIGAYITSMFIHFPFPAGDTNLPTVTLVTLLSLIFSLLGFHISKQIVLPVMEVSQAAQKIAEGKLNETTDFKGADELEDLSRSLHTISDNARELLNKVDKLTLKDKLTGLYNASYIRERLNEEIQRAIHYQRPCSFAYVTIDNFNDYAAINGQAASEEVLKTMADIFNRVLSEFDRAARITNDEFGIIFFDRNKKKAIELVDEIRKHVSQYAFKNAKVGELTISVGLSENPLDGITAGELYSKAQSRVKAARKKGNNLVEAFA